MDDRASIPIAKERRHLNLLGHLSRDILLIHAMVRSEEDLRYFLRRRRQAVVLRVRVDRKDPVATIILTHACARSGLTIVGLHGGLVLLRNLSKRRQSNV